MHSTVDQHSQLRRYSRPREEPVTHLPSETVFQFTESESGIAASSLSPGAQALLRGLSGAERDELQGNGIRSVLSVPLVRQGRELGHVRCESQAARTPSLELHAAAELFTQMVAVELDRLLAD